MTESKKFSMNENEQMGQDPIHVFYKWKLWCDINENFVLSGNINILLFGRLAFYCTFK